jgi:autotransporter-associated beta strand protein
MKIKDLPLILASLAFFAGGKTARADFHVWTGAANGYWSNTNNWQNGSAPYLFESSPVYLDFPPGAALTTVTNDINYGYFGPLYVDTFIVTGDNYVISGIGDGAKIVMTGNPAPLFNINLQNFYCTGSNITFDASLNLTLNQTNSITNSPGCTLDMKATLSGSGGWTFEGSGRLLLDGPNANTCTGPCQVVAGTVALQRTYCGGECFGRTAINGPLAIGLNRPGPPAQVVETNSYGAQLSGAPVTIYRTGSLVLVGYAPEVVTNLTLFSGTITFGGVTGYDGYGNAYAYFGHLDVATLTNYPTFLGNPSVISGHGYGSGILWSGSYTTTASLGLMSPGSNLPAIIHVDGQLLLDTEIAVDPMATNINSFAKTGPGTLTLISDNDYRVSTLIEQGVVVAGGPGPLGQLFSGGTNKAVVFSGAQLIVNTNATFNVPVELNGYGTNGAGGALLVLHDGALFRYGVIAGSDSSMVVANGAGNVTFAGYFSAPLTGSANFHKHGPGTLTLNYFGGADALTGTAFVDEGTLTLDSATNHSTLMLNGPLVIGTNAEVLELVPQQLGSNSPVTINDGGLLDLYNNAQSIGSLTLNGGTVAYGGPLILNGDVTAQPGSSEPLIYSGSLLLGGTNRNFTVAAGSALVVSADITDGVNSAGLTKAGWGELDLHGTGTYRGPTGVNSGRLSVFNSAALGYMGAGLTIAQGSQLVLNNGVQVGNKPLFIGGTGLAGVGALIGSGTNSWAGPVTLTADTTIYVYTNNQTELSGVITGPYGLTKTGPGILLLDGTQPNNYSGLTSLQQGVLALAKTNGAAVPGSLVAGTGTGPANSAQLELFLSGQLNPTAPVTLNSDGLLELNSAISSSAGSVSGSGELALGFGQFSAGSDNSSTLFSGPIVGLGSTLTKVGTGAWTLSGVSSYFGQTRVGSGTLFVDGYLGNGSIVVSNGATLSGIGTVGTLNALGGSTLSPGHGVGTLSSGPPTLGSGSTCLVQISGTNAAYNVLNANGTITENNPTLKVVMTTPGGTNYHYVFINNALNNPVTGTFAGLPEGATVVANNGAHFTITYKGNKGNDVELTQTSVPVPPSLTAINRLTNGNVTVSGTGVPNVTYHLQANTNLATTNWGTLGPVTANNLGVLIFTDSQAGTYPARFYRFVYP